MGRSLKKGPFVDHHLMKKVRKLDLKLRKIFGMHLQEIYHIKKLMMKEIQLKLKILIHQKI